MKSSVLHTEDIKCLRNEDSYPTLGGCFQGWAPLWRRIGAGGRGSASAERTVQPNRQNEQYRALHLQLQSVQMLSNATKRVNGELLRWATSNTTLTLPRGDQRCFWLALDHVTTAASLVTISSVPTDRLLLFIGTERRHFYRNGSKCHMRLDLYHCKFLSSSKRLSWRWFCYLDVFFLFFFF